MTYYAAISIVLLTGTIQPAPKVPSRIVHYHCDGNAKVTKGDWDYSQEAPEGFSTQARDNDANSAYEPLMIGEKGEIKICSQSLSSLVVSGPYWSVRQTRPMVLWTSGQLPQNISDDEFVNASIKSGTNYTFHPDSKTHLTCYADVLPN